MQKMRNLVGLLVVMALMTAFLGCAATQTSESTGQYVDDSVITTRVKTAIFGDPELKTMQIGVETYKGEVQLSGFVNSPESLRRAGEIARSVNGVKSVRNSLIVK